MGLEPDEIEERLGRLVPTAPRAGLREEVLRRVHAELDRGARRGLARPLPWAVAAALLIASLLLGGALEAAAAARLKAAKLPPVGPAATEIAALLPEGGGRQAVLLRLRIDRKRALENDPARRRWVEYVLRLKRGEIDHV